MNNTSDGNGPDDPPTSLLPYDRWLEDAYREVMLSALDYAAANGLPGEHHFYISFRTDASKVVIPAALRAQYPQEMTIVLQYQFWDLIVDRIAKCVSVGLSFNGVGSKLTLPIAAITGFSDPAIGIALSFRAFDESSDPGAPGDAAEDGTLVATQALETEGPEPEDGEAQVVRLDAFRKRSNTPPQS